MSQIDQAFIRAFDADSAAGIPAPTLPMPSATTTAPQTGPHFAVAVPAALPTSDYRLAAEVDPYTEGLQLYDQPPLAEPPPQAPPAISAPGERRPLSSFALPTDAPSEPSFRALLEVDAFRWPVVCDELLQQYAALFAPVVQQLLEAGEAGRSMVGVVGMDQGAGCTTVQLCLAKLLAAAGKNIAIVDADFATAQLAGRLGLEIATGWEDVLSGTLPLAECVVQSVEDRIVLLPLVRPSDSATDLLSSIHASVSAGMLRYQFDLVLFDLGTAGRGPQAAAAKAVGAQCRLDACLAVSAGGPTNLSEIEQIANHLGAECLGLIENQILAVSHQPSALSQ